ncbi:hypothetical protein BDV96DRAFT_171976 [Lophiotrema nucula]|uniref:N-acetyltransferase domain-containing protein n=1 Tax=Lophiotrema nucula TaxID=690887 RepID=A0A6A5YYH2_9PLEO|nr:hypothetical protein BDV96DRAFT_171976 [Lophiotrema nucula]
MEEGFLTQDELSSPLLTPISYTMASKYTGREITEEHILQAADLFSKHYGIWGPRHPRAGQRVQTSPAMLKRNYLPDGAEHTLVQAHIGYVLVGHAIATRWSTKKSAESQPSRVCWITQLCVRRGYRAQGVATSILRKMAEESDDMYGILSSHPAAIMAALRAFANGPETDTDALLSMTWQATNIMTPSPISYVKSAAPDPGSTVRSVDTNFDVDHGEHQAVLDELSRLGRTWWLGDLKRKHEYILIIPTLRQTPTNSSAPTSQGEGRG